MPTAKKSLPSFDRPPLIEVVCSVAFTSLDKLLAPHTGLLWEKFRAEYGQIEEVPPIGVLLDGQVVDPQVELLTKPPLPRIWFVNEKNNSIIQVQRDRFMHNWRKQEGTDYPRFSFVFGEFDRQFKVFRNFVKKHELGEIRPLQYELTYVNHIPHGEPWESLGQVPKVFKVFNEVTNKRLGEPQAINWSSLYLLKDGEGKLSYQLQTAKRLADDTSILQLNITARGLPKGLALDDLSGWFSRAHEEIVLGFEDLTDQSTQDKVWRKIR